MWKPTQSPERLPRRAEAAHRRLHFDSIDVATGLVHHPSAAQPARRGTIASARSCSPSPRQCIARRIYSLLDLPHSMWVPGGASRTNSRLDDLGLHHILKRLTLLVEQNHRSRQTNMQREMCSQVAAQQTLKFEMALQMAIKRGQYRFQHPELCVGRVPSEYRQLCGR